MSASVSFSILMLVTIICLLVLTFFVVKLVISVTKLTDNANTIATSVQKEIEPTLQELKEAAKSINSIANSADAKFKDAKMGLASLVGASACLSGKLKTFVQGISKGISFGINLFKKQ
jgi:predicted PurR-regulated permease PerM